MTRNVLRDLENQTAINKLLQYSNIPIIQNLLTFFKKIIRKKNFYSNLATNLSYKSKRFRSIKYYSNTIRNNVSNKTNN